jgi:hypothetical protein
MLEDMNALTEKIKIMRIIGRSGASTINNNGRKLTDFCVINERLMNSFFNHEDIQKLFGALANQ